MAAQFAAEATLRRVHAAQKDDDMPPIEAILAPLEAELKLARQEVMPCSCEFCTKKILSFGELFLEGEVFYRLFMPVPPIYSL